MSNEPEYPFVPYLFDKPTPQEVGKRSADFLRFVDKRRSVREFSSDAVPKQVINDLIMAASTSPSGAHRQPWTFVAVSNPEIKRRIREAAEHEERLSYGGRMPPDWLRALEPLGTNAEKPFLEIAPWLVVLFRQDYGIADDGSSIRHYYVSESVGIAAGMFIAAVHHAGLATLTHTPSPMAFLAEILDRPKNEKPFLLFPVGYPADGVTVPDLTRKPLEQVGLFRE